MTNQNGSLATARQRLLTGWGRTAASVATVVSPTDTESQQEVVRSVDANGVVARGLGRGYGDCAQNAGGTVIDGPSRAGVLSVDLDRHIVTALAGTTLDSLMGWFVPKGMFVPVTPGTRQVTVGGAIAADIHGKNHHVKGSFGSHVISLRLVDGSGEVRDIHQDRDPEIFWATVGGMGLTGIIIDATIQMQPIESSAIVVDTDRTANLDEVMSLMIEGDADYDYSVAWIDLIATGASMGRSILDRGRFATRAEATAAGWGGGDPLRYNQHDLVSVPDIFPSGLLNPLTIRAFNELWYRKAPAQRRDHLMSIEAFFHPLDMVGDWNRIYGPRGFLQWQCVVPDEATELMRSMVQQLSSAGTSSFLAVLKRMGPQNAGYLSFPSSGWTLALDLPVAPGLERLLDRLDDQVLDAGGRLYLAKDSRMRPELIPAMYPRIDEWREIRDGLDPDRRFRSDLARRLDLI